MEKNNTPSIQVLKDLNKVILFTEALSQNSAFPEKNIILKAVSSVSYGDKKGHVDSLAFLIKLGLINISDNNCQLTPAGKNFLKLNPNKYVEVNRAQKKLLLKLFLESKQFKIALLSILSRYGYPDVKNIIIDPSISVSSNESHLLSALKWLEFFKEREGVLYIDTKNLAFLNKMNTSTLSLRQLESILNGESRYFKKAEKMALGYEKRRLRKKGLTIQSNLVKLVSEKNVLLGYDLLSFSNENSFQYDRFIEVKCSKSDKVRFFWSRNEYLAAKKLKKNYWIYFFPKITTDNRSPLLFRNPSEIFKAPKYTVLSTEFVIEEN